MTSIISRRAPVMSVLGLSLVLGCGSSGNQQHTSLAVHRAALAGGASRDAAAAPRVALQKMIGQQVMAKMSGTSPDRVLLGRIRRGEVGGVILYSENIVSPGQTRALVRRLQAAARSGGNPRLLISTDQEGGQVKRLPWAPPTISPPAMGARGSSVSRSQGTRTGRALRAVGINVDLAPVVDVAHSSGAFIWRQGRSFGMSAGRVIRSALPFALGMRGTRVAPTEKHFPGVGGASIDTDFAKQTISVGRKDLLPYRSVVKNRLPLVMVSTGVYPGLDGSRAPAALSHRIISGLLRKKLGFGGVVITDDLERPTGYSTAQATVRSDAAGADIILVSSSEQGGVVAYRSMLRAARSGKIPRNRVADAYSRILALKARYA
jgi:beta-N-acetylhexosaminidase